MTKEDGSISRNRPDKKLGLERHLDRLPPEWVWWRIGLVGIGEMLVYGSALILAATCLNLLFKNPVGLKCTCWIYVPGALLLIGLCMVRLLRYPFRVHEARLVDRTEAEALFDGGKDLLKASEGGQHSSSNGDKDRDTALRKLIECRIADGPSTWTEYRVLPVEQGAVRLLSVEDLIARANARLDDLREYDEKRTDAEKEYFRERAERLRESIELAQKTKPNDEAKETKPNDEAKGFLEADLRMLLETLADYDKNWAVGSEMLRALLIVISVTIPIFLLMGIAPILLPSLSGLGFMNWALLGAAGSLTAVLRKLYLRNKVDVGESEGKNELYQAIEGAILGMVSGVLVYTMLWGELLSGHIVPDVGSATINDIYLSVFWAFMTGFTFETFFDRAQREHFAQHSG